MTCETCKDTAFVTAASRDTGRLEHSSCEDCKAGKLREVTGEMYRNTRQLKRATERVKELLVESDELRERHLMIKLSK